MAEAISPELVERMVALIRDLRADHLTYDCEDRVQDFVTRTKAIVDELPAPVDPDLIEARKIAAAEADGVDKPEYWSNLTGGDDYLKGQWDHTWRVRTILAAIKRGRELEQSNA